MAATAVLRSQHCLHQSHIRNSHCNHNPKPNPRHRSRKRSPGFNGQNETENRIPDRTNPNLPLFPKNMVMGQVKILKRGDPLPEGNKKINDKPKLKETPADKKVGTGVNDYSDFALGSTGRLGPEPEIVQKQIKVSDFYAGSAPLVTSPHPSSLPLPVILTKKEKKIDDSISNFLLRLD